LLLAALMNRIERQHGLHTPEHAEKNGFVGKTRIIMKLNRRNRL